MISRIEAVASGIIPGRSNSPGKGLTVVGDNAQSIGARKDTITGNPDPQHISTSYTERANLTMRMSMRRFSRLTNAFSKKLTNHAHMVALYALWYNFVRIHKTLRVTPAMAAGVSDRLWSMEDVVAADRCAVSQGKRRNAGRMKWKSHCGFN